MAGRLACPKRTHTTGLRAPLRSSRPALHSGSQKFRHSTELDGATRAALNSPLKDCEPNANLVARRLAHITRACRRCTAFATVSAMPISWNEIRHNAIRFSRDWTGGKSESAEKQTFWNEFFQ